MQCKYGKRMCSRSMLPQHRFRGGESRTGSDTEARERKGVEIAAERQRHREDRSRSSRRPDGTISVSGVRDVWLNHAIQYR